MITVIILIAMVAIGGIVLLCVMMAITVYIIIPRPCLPAYQNIRMPDGRVLSGPDKVLGQGAFATVCQYALDNNRVAVKIPNSAEYNEMQQHELELLKKVNPHPHVVQLIEHVEISYRLCIVIELMQGSVRDLLDKNPRLSSKTKLSIALQMAKGVDHLHHFSSALFLKKAIVHQDLKPDNLLVNTLNDNPNIQIKISDFGIARQCDQVILPIWGKIASKLYKGHAGGTLLYTAPEIISAIDVNRDCCEPKSDVFSEGIILWELATTRRPQRSLLEIKHGGFHEFTSDKESGRRRITHQSFFGAKTQIWSAPTYPKSSFFGPVIDKCIQPEIDERLSARKILEALQRISIQ